MEPRIVVSLALTKVTTSVADPGCLLFIPDPGSDFSIPDLGSKRSQIRKFQYFDQGCLSRIRIPDPDPGSRIQGLKKHRISDPDPQPLG
jgi:hypothetical protein